MAPKRSAPPPPVESSEETAAGSGTDESEEEEEEIVHSPPSAFPKNTAPPPQKVQQPESSDDEEDEEDGEEEEEQEEDGEEEDMGEEESESDEEEEEAPQPEAARKQKAEANGGKLPPSSKDKKPFERAWSKDDEIRILQALAAHRREHGTLPQVEDLEAALAGKLDNSNYGRKELAGKLSTLKASYNRTLKKVDPPSDDTGRRIFDLSKEVWGGSDKPAPANGTVPSDFGEMCMMYPYLGEELKAVERTYPGLFKRAFSKIDSGKARDLDQKVKKLRVRVMKLEQRNQDATKQVTKALMDLME